MGRSGSEEADGSEPVVETREVVYVGGGQERVRVRRGSGAGAGTGTIILERWTTHVEDGERRVAVVDRHTVGGIGSQRFGAKEVIEEG
ncbi:MAG: hypothetical protein R3B06_12580 [Kofleriaceae bacterium]